MKIACIAGAGLSTASGIPDFKGKNGLYNQKWRGYNPETLLDVDTLYNNTELFYEFFREKMLLDDVKPNAAHYALKELEDLDVLTSVITQNIDGLESVAGIQTVRQIHGTIHSYHCTNCGEAYSLGYIQNTTGVPKCHCGAFIRPDVVMYGENLSMDYNEAVMDVFTADTLFIIGTSLSVYPAAGLVDLFHGNQIVIFNQGATPFDSDHRAIKMEKPLEIALPNFVRNLKKIVLEEALKEDK